MKECYKSKFKLCFDQETHTKKTKQSENSKHYNKVIAALICDNNGKPYVAVIGTGTRKNDKNKCEKDCVCDGHAESICFEAAPMYFQEQMLHVSHDKEDSIFTYNSKKCIYELKPGVTFHLLVTEPPCGFIRENKEPCMQWKPSHECEIPHIPTCSSRILIAAQIGIQGYVTHLLDKPIVVDTITILFCKDENKNEQKIKFDTEKMQKLKIKYEGEEKLEMLKMPIIQKKSYDPKDFNDGQACEFKPMNLIPGSTSSDNRPHEGYQHCYVGIYSPSEGIGSIVFKFDPQKQTVKYYSGKNDSYFMERKIYDELQIEINEKEYTEKKRSVREIYDQLKEILKLSTALDSYHKNLQSRFENYKTNQGETKQKVLTEVERALNGLITNNYKEEIDQVLMPIKKDITDFWKSGCDMVNLSEHIQYISKCVESKKNPVMDCSWEAYFNNDSFSSMKPSCND